VAGPVVKLVDSWVHDVADGVQLLVSLLPVPLSPRYTYWPSTQPVSV
jgi:hypothetical protein